MQIENSYQYQKSSPHAKAYKALYRFAIKLLTNKEYSNFALKKKLLNYKYAKESSHETVQQVLDDLTEKNFLSEARYREARVRGLARKYYSINYIQLKLKQEHVLIEKNEIEEIFQEIKMSEDMQIRYLLQKKLPKIFCPLELEIQANLKEKKKETPYSPEQILKVKRYLVMSKGHSYEKINSMF